MPSNNTTTDELTTGTTRTMRNPGLIDANADQGGLTIAPATTNTGAPAPPPAATPPATPASRREYTPAEASSLGLGWVDTNHPLYGTAGYVGSEGAGTGGGTTPGGTGTGTGAASYSDPGSVEARTAQANAASTYSATPGAAPTQNTTNQGTQDVLRNTLLDQATQSLEIDRTDPIFRGQADAYAAASERARRNAVDGVAQSEFSDGSGSSGGMNVEQRAINETAAQNAGSFEATLAQQELVSRRAEIAQSLAALGNLTENDQGRALTKQLADIDAAIRRESLTATTGLAQQDLALRGQLGNAGLALDGRRIDTQDRQFYAGLGVDAGYKEGLLNNSALGLLLGS